MKFMGHRLVLSKVRGGWYTDQRSLPMVSFFTDIHGKWHGILTLACRGTNLGVRNRPSFRAARVALEKQVRELIASLESFT